MNKLSLIFKWNQMNVQGMETFRNIKQKNDLMQMNQQFPKQKKIIMLSGEILCYISCCIFCHINNED